VNCSEPFERLRTSPHITAAWQVKMANVRTFIAVLLRTDLKNKISVVQKQFIKAAPEVKWVDEENFHVTLKFLGDVDTERLGEICAALESAVSEEEAFSMQVACAGAFPSLSRPRVVWIGLQTGVERLSQIAAKIESELERVGFPKEERRFSAHVTIGRVRPDRPFGALAKAIEEAEVGEIGEARVDSIAVMKSDLCREGPVYSVLKEIRLGLG
jgi:RNA 2',3'-cyclic 3'-phosphodiesterase